jgi:hypothetical protein
VFIASDAHRDFQTTIGDLADLTKQVALILTGVDIHQLDETFGGYRVYEPATGKELVPSQLAQAGG